MSFFYFFNNDLYYFSFHNILSCGKRSVVEPPSFGKWQQMGTKIGNSLKTTGYLLAGTIRIDALSFLENGKLFSWTIYQGITNIAFAMRVFRLRRMHWTQRQGKSLANIWILITIITISKSPYLLLCILTHNKTVFLGSKLACDIFWFFVWKIKTVEVSLCLIYKKKKLLLDTTLIWSLGKLEKEEIIGHRVRALHLILLLCIACMTN